jgi:hypothetical protein
MKATTPDQFFASWKFKLSHDFEVEGEPAAFYPEHPKQWGSEDIHIQPPVNNDLLEEHPMARSPPMAVSHDGTFLAVGVGSDIVIYDVIKLFVTLTLETPHQCVSDHEITTSLLSHPLFSMVGQEVA